MMSPQQSSRFMVAIVLEECLLRPFTVLVKSIVAWLMIFCSRAIIAILSMPRNRWQCPETSEKKERDCLAVNYDYELENSPFSGFAIDRNFFFIKYRDLFGNEFRWRWNSIPLFRAATEFPIHSNCKLEHSTTIYWRGATAGSIISPQMVELQFHSRPFFTSLH